MAKLLYSKLFCLLAVILLFTACAGTYYSPTTMPAYFAKRNDIAAIATVNAKSIQAYTAWSPVKFLYVAGSGQTHFNNSHSGWEIGAGGYLHPTGLLYIDGGAGTGHAKFFYEDPISGSYNSFVLAKGDYTKTFISMNVGIRAGIAKWGIGGRYNWLKQHYDPNFNGNTFYHDYLSGRTFKPNVAELYFSQEYGLSKSIFLTNVLGLNYSPQDDTEIQPNYINFRIGIIFRFNASGKPDAFPERR